MTITVDTGNISSKGNVANATSPQTWSHTTGANVDMIVVIVTIYDTSSSDGIVSAVSFDGKALALSFVNFDAVADAHLSVWWRANADIQNITGTVSVTFGGAVTDFQASAVGVEGTVNSFDEDSVGTMATGNGSPSVSWSTSDTNTILFDAMLDDNKDPQVTADSPQSEIHNTDVGTDQVGASYKIVSSSGSQTMSWTDTGNDEDWAINGVAFKESAGPATLVIQDVNHTHTVASPLLTQLHNIIIQDVQHSHTVASPLLAQVHNITIQDVHHTHAAESAFWLIQNHNITIKGVQHTHIIENPLLTQVHNITIQDVQHTHTVENPLLTQIHNITIQDGQHTHYVDNINFAGGAILVIQDGQHTHYIAKLDLTQLHNIIIQDVQHAHTVGSGFWLTQLHNLVVQDGGHTQNVENLALTQLHNLAIQDGQHEHIVDGVTLGALATVWGMIYYPIMRRRRDAHKNW